MEVRELEPLAAGPEHDSEFSETPRIQMPPGAAPPNYEHARITSSRSQYPTGSYVEVDCPEDYPPSQLTALQDGQPRASGLRFESDASGKTESGRSALGLSVRTGSIEHLPYDGPVPGEEEDISVRPKLERNGSSGESRDNRISSGYSTLLFSPTPHGDMDPMALEGSSNVKKRGLVHSNKYQIAFVVVIAFQSVAVIAMIATVYLKIRPHIIRTNGKVIFTGRILSVAAYVIIYALSAITELLLALDGIRERNTMQLIGLCILNAIMLAYSVILPIQLADTIKDPDGDDQDQSTIPNGSADSCDRNEAGELDCAGLGVYPRVHIYLLVCIGVTAFVTVVMCLLTRKLHRLFLDHVYRTVTGADPHRRTYHTYYEIFVCLMKFDWFFFAAFAIQLLIYETNITGLQFRLTVAAVPILASVLILAGFGVQRESHVLMSLFSLTWVVSLVYLGYKTYRLISRDHTSANSMANTLSLFSISTGVLLILTAGAAVMCWMSFGKGMKERYRRRVRPLSLAQPPTARPLVLDD